MLIIGICKKLNAFLNKLLLCRYYFSCLKRWLNIIQPNEFDAT